MIYFKVIGAIFVAISGVMLTVTLNRRTLTVLRQTEGWEQLFGQIKTEVECFSLPISDILARTDRSLLRHCGYVGADAPRDLSELVENTAFSDAEAGRIARRFASEFGRCYKGEQVERCAYFTSLMSNRRQRIAEELPSKRKLTTTLCIASSLGILIFFF